MFRSKYAETNYGKPSRYHYRTRDRERDKEKSSLNDEINGKHHFNSNVSYIMHLRSHPLF